MSTAFTSLATGGNAQSLTMANELVLAYSERRQAVGQSAVSNLSVGDDAQDKTLWLAMQVWLETNCTSFVDHVNGPLNPAGTAFLYFTLATWRTAAGLNASGFRRSTDGTTMLYGNIQADDVRGKWCFEDLQKAFGVLKWTMRLSSTNMSSSKGANAAAEETVGGTCIETLALCSTRWGIATWSSYAESTTIYSVGARQESPEYFQTPEQFFDSRTRGYAKINGIPLLPCTANIYFKPVFTNLESGSSFQDIDSLGLTENLIFLSESLVETTTTTKQGTITYGDDEDAPLDILGWGCPYSFSGEVYQKECTFLYSYFLFKWNFTNA